MRDGEGPDIVRRCKGCDCELREGEGHSVNMPWLFPGSSFLGPDGWVVGRPYVQLVHEIYCDKCYEGSIGVFETKEDQEELSKKVKLTEEEKQKISFDYNNLLGKMGENLVENIFKSRFKLYHFGYELITENIAQLDNKPKQYTEAHSMICVSPDFLFYSAEEGLIFVEVKTFRKYNLQEQIKSYNHGRSYYKIRDLIKYYPGVLIVNLIWNTDKPEIKLYSGRLNTADKKELLEIKEEPLERLFTEAEKNRLIELLKEVTPPNLPVTKEDT